MSKIRVRIKESTTYDHEFQRYELAALLIKDGHDAAELAQLSDAELADLAETDRSPATEDAMQSYGDVDGSGWTVSVVL